MNKDDGQRKRRKRSKNDKKSNFTSAKPSSVEVTETKVEVPPIERLHSNSSASTIDFGNNKQLDSVPQERPRAISSELKRVISAVLFIHKRKTKGTRPFIHLMMVSFHNGYAEEAESNNDIFLLI